MTEPAPSALGSLSKKEVVLLGLLAEEPMHAYGLREKIRVRQMTRWADISDSSVYRLLTRLEKRGLLESRLDHGGGAATRKVHALTRPGRRALATGVLEHLTVLGRSPTPFQVSLANLTRANRAQVLVRLEARAAEVGGALAHLDSVERIHAGLASEGDDEMVKEPGSALSARLLLDYMRRHLRAERAFLDDALGSISGADPGTFEE